MAFSEMVKKLRKEHHWTQEELAGRVSVTTRTVQNWEAGRAYPKTEESIQALEKAFGLSANEIFTEEDLFLVEAIMQGGNRAKREARVLIQKAAALFAGGRLTEEDKQEVFQALKDAYLHAGKENKKYGPGKKSQKS